MKTLKLQTDNFFVNDLKSEVIALLSKIYFFFPRKENFEQL